MVVWRRMWSDGTDEIACIPCRRALTRLVVGQVFSVVGVVLDLLTSSTLQVIFCEGEHCQNLRCPSFFS